MRQAVLVMPSYVWRPRDFDTRLCQAFSCPNDADGFWGLCTMHARQQDAGREVRIHQNPPQTGPLLWCGACRTDKPDAEFPFRASHGKASGGRANARRDRYWCCSECIAKGRTK